jgi:hypothetical protein
MKENQGKQSFPSLKMFLYFEGKHIYCQGITEGNGFNPLSEPWASTHRPVSPMGWKRSQRRNLWIYKVCLFLIICGNLRNLRIILITQSADRFEP